MQQKLLQGQYEEHELALANRERPWELEAQSSWCRVYLMEAE